MEITKHCKKCGKEYSGFHKYCNDCGRKLDEKKDVEKTHHSKSHKRIYWTFGIIGVFLVISAIIIFAIPLPYNATELYSEKEPYTTTEYYSENEPYETTEYYEDTEQYIDKECGDVALTKNVKWGTTQKSCIDTTCTSYKSVCTETNWYGGCIEYTDVCQSESCSKYTIYCNLVVKNLDDKGGTFNLDGYYVTKDEKEHYIEALSKYLQPGDEHSFTWNYNVDVKDLGSCTYKNFVTPKKTECENVIKSKTVQKSLPIIKYQEVTKSKEVTKYKDVEKTRTVTKYATLFQRWTGKVQWYYTV